MYIIVREDSKYVACPGMEHSYTNKLEDARIFLKEGEANENKCPENERVLPLTAVLGGLPR
jgi:uncharacterized Zn-finger protein